MAERRQRNYEKPVTEEQAVVEEVVKEKPARKNTVKVIAEKLNLRESDSKNSDVLAILNKDEKLIVSKTIGEWLEVTSEAGVTGYVMKEFTA